jgi:hypothetical protein
MKKGLYIIGLLMLFIFNGNKSNGQSYVADYKAAMDNLTKHKFATVGFKISFFANSPAKADKTYRGEYIISGKRYYSKFNTTESIINEKYSVTVDHNEKFVYVDKGNNPNPLFMIQGDVLDSVFNKFQNKISFSKDGTYSRYNISTVQESPYKSIEIWFDSKARLLRKIKIIGYAELDPFDENAKLTDIDPIVIMEFDKYDFSDKGNSYFDVSKYLVSDAKGLKLSAPFSKYKLLNPKDIR